MTLKRIRKVMWPYQNSACYSEDHTRNGFRGDAFHSGLRMAYTLEEFDSVLSRAHPVNVETPAATLRKWRTELVRASVFISYAIGVLSLDLEILNRSLKTKSENALQELVDELPGLLTSGWLGGGWSLSPDASASVGAAAELASDQAKDLLGLHAELAQSDLTDKSKTGDLLRRVEGQREALIERREKLEEKIRKIQESIRSQYASGAASVDDWLK